MQRKSTYLRFHLNDRNSPILSFFIANGEDPLKKREQFAVSLRREKTKQIISAKRRRLL